MSSVSLAKKFIIDRIVKSELEAGDTIEHWVLYSFNSDNIDSIDLTDALNQLAEDGFVEKIFKSNKDFIKLTKKGYKQFYHEIRNSKN